MTLLLTIYLTNQLIINRCIFRTSLYNSINWIKLNDVTMSMLRKKVYVTFVYLKGTMWCLYPVSLLIAWCGFISVPIWVSGCMCVSGFECLINCILWLRTKTDGFARGTDLYPLIGWGKRCKRFTSWICIKTSPSVLT